MLAARIKRQIAASGARRGCLSKNQERDQQRGKRKPDQERFTPPPPDRVSAAAARRARWAAVSWRAVCFTPATLHQRPTPVIPAPHLPSLLRPLPVIPAQAGTHHPNTHTTPFPQFIPPPFQGGG